MKLILKNSQIMVRSKIVMSVLELNKKKTNVLRKRVVEGTKSEWTVKEAYSVATFSLLKIDLVVTSFIHSCHGSSPSPNVHLFPTIIFNPYINISQLLSTYFCMVSIEILI